jgi:hypothetical protein
MTTTKVTNINIEGGFRHGNDRTLSFRINDSVSGAVLVEVDMDAQQVLNLLSGLQDNYAGGSAEFYDKSFPRIGKLHVVIDTVLQAFSEKADVSHFDGVQAGFVKALRSHAPDSWEILPASIKSLNHHYCGRNEEGRTYRSGLHLYIPAEVTREAFEDFLADLMRTYVVLATTVKVDRIYSGGWSK